VNRKKRLVYALVSMALTGSAIGCAVAPAPEGGIAVAASQLTVAPNCVINDFFISGNQSDGGVGSYDTFVYLTNNGSMCRLVPIGARAYNVTTHSFVGAAAAITKPDVKPGQLFPYATRRLLGTIAYGQSVSLLLSYADVGLGALRDCGKVAAASAMAFWMKD
jgi:hypothetical protein